jgi:hypothetical protein
MLETNTQMQHGDLPPLKDASEPTTTWTLMMYTELERAVSNADRLLNIREYSS